MATFLSLMSLFFSGFPLQNAIRLVQRDQPDQSIVDNRAVVHDASTRIFDAAGVQESRGHNVSQPSIGLFQDFSLSAAASTCYSAAPGVESRSVIAGCLCAPNCLRCSDSGRMDERDCEVCASDYVKNVVYSDGTGTCDLETSVGICYDCERERNALTSTYHAPGAFFEDVAQGCIGASTEVNNCVCSNKCATCGGGETGRRRRSGSRPTNEEDCLTCIAGYVLIDVDVEHNSTGECVAPGPGASRRRRRRRKRRHHHQKCDLPSIQPSPDIQS